MNNPTLAVLDLPVIAAHLLKQHGKTFTHAEVAAWLDENDFQAVGKRWLADAGSLPRLPEGAIIEFKPIVLNDDHFGQRKCLTISDPHDEAPRRTTYILLKSRREELAKMPDNDKCLVPSLFVGLHRDVAKRSRRFFQKVLKDRSWQPALSKQEFVHIDHSPGVLLTNPDKSFADEENVILYYPQDEDGLDADLDKFCTREEEPVVLNKLIMESGDDFWFALCVVTGLWGWLSRIESLDRELLMRTARHIMPSVLRWWPQFCARNDRFFYSRSSSSVGWPSWGAPVAMSDALGWPLQRSEIRDLTPEAAGKLYLERWQADQKS